MHNVFSIHTNICFVCETVEKKKHRKNRENCIDVAYIVSSPYSWISKSI